VNALFGLVKVRTFQMQTKGLVFESLLVSTLSLKSFKNVFICRRNESWKKTGAARFQIYFMHRMNSFPAYLIVEHHSPGAIKLQVDKTWCQILALEINLFN